MGKSRRGRKMFKVTTPYCGKPAAGQQHVGQCEWFTTVSALRSILATQHIAMSSVRVPNAKPAKASSSFLLLRDLDSQRLRAGLITLSLLLGCASHASCHWECTKRLTVGKRFRAGRGKWRVHGTDTARLAADSASSLPVMPTWLGIQ